MMGKSIFAVAAALAFACGGSKGSGDVVPPFDGGDDGGSPDGGGNPDSGVPDRGLPNPALYKSGDADRISLSGGGLAASHYDISSGPGVVPAEPRGREKLCTVYRIVYQHGTNYVWFGANHGFALGFADSTRVIEHAHP